MNSATVAPLIKFIKILDASSSSVLVLFSNADWQRTFTINASRPSRERSSTSEWS